MEDLGTNRTLLQITIFLTSASTSLGAGAAPEMPADSNYTNSIGMGFVRIEPGRFLMGFEGTPLAKELLTKKGHFRTGDFDEYPNRPVRITRPFYMGVYEVTNAQYERFDPNHRKWRGRNGYSEGDDEAVIFVSWRDAVAFCGWLSDKEGLAYRLPTEAEWEYACRAGTNAAFYTGRTLPREFQEAPESSDHRLKVGRTPPNAWGLYDMHGNVEEWCCDWYGPYEPGPQLDPVGRMDGHFKVTRGGSHWTEPYYLRCANRLGSHPDDRQWMIGFRVVIGPMPASEALPKITESYQRFVRQTVGVDVKKGPDLDKPYFSRPRVFVNIAADATGPLFGFHNHFTAVAECPNGDLLAAWFTCMEEMGRELGIAVSRLRYGHQDWEPASPFWDAPDRNDHTQALWYDGKDTIYHFNGLGVKYRRLALLLRKSDDNGATWSRARIIFDHDPNRSNKIVESVFRTQEGHIVVPMDGRGGSVIAISRDRGRTWFDPGGSIRGTHAGVVQLTDGSLMAFGRHGQINGKMPVSFSADMGKTWAYEASPFQPIHSGRRVALMRLKQGPIFFASFCHEMTVKNAAGGRHAVTGLFAAVSLDEGKTWPYRRLVTDDGPGREVQTMDGDPIIMDRRNAEPVGYLAVCQGADGVIHLLTSRQHYAFNLKWLMTLSPAAPPAAPAPKAQQLPVKKTLSGVYRPRIMPGQDDWGWNYNGPRSKQADILTVCPDGVLKIKTNAAQQFWLRTEKNELFSELDPKKGFTAEIKTRLLERNSDNRGVDLELYDGAGSRYAITVTDTAVYWYDGLVQSSSFLPFKQYVPLAEQLDNTDAMHVYRLAVRPDRVVQIYRDGRLLGARPVKYRTPRSPYIYFGAGAEVEALVEYVAYDLSGPSQPK